MALVAFLDSSFLSLPEVNDVLMVLMVVRNPDAWIYYAAMTTLGSVAGCFALFSVAQRGGEAFLRKRFSERHVERGLRFFQRYGLLAVIVPSILPPPTPFKIFVLLAGVANVRKSTFLLAVALGRGFRYGSEGLLAYLYGEEATHVHQGESRPSCRCGWPSPSSCWAPRSSCGAATGPRRMGTAVAPEISVVIPIFNEAPNLEQLHRELTAALEPAGRSYELIFVDDGSTDGSFDTLRALHARDPRVGVIQFRRNFGQTAAFAAGFAAARGRVIVTSDGDLQNDPRDIPAMVARLDAGFDIVCGWRKDRKDAWLSRRLPSFLANRLISWATGVRLNDYGCSLKVFRAEVVKPLRLYGEMHRFLPALASEMGVRIDERPVNHRARIHGRSKYGISRTIRVILDLLTVKFLLSYSTRPLQMFGVIGIGMGALGDRLRARVPGRCEVPRPRGDRQTGPGCCCSASCSSSPACSCSRRAAGRAAWRARITSRRTSRSSPSARRWLRNDPGAVSPWRRNLQFPKRERKLGSPTEPETTPEVISTASR